MKKTMPEWKAWHKLLVTLMVEKAESGCGQIEHTGLCIYIMDMRSWGDISPQVEQRMYRRLATKKLPYFTPGEEDRDWTSGADRPHITNRLRWKANAWRPRVRFIKDLLAKEWGL